MQINEYCVLKKMNESHKNHMQMKHVKQLHVKRNDSCEKNRIK